MNIPTPQQIVEAAEAKGLSMAAVCRRADIDATAFYRWQKGTPKPNLMTVQKRVAAIDSAPQRVARGTAP